MDGMTSADTIRIQGRMKPIKRLVFKLFTPQNLSHSNEVIACPKGTHLEEGEALNQQVEAFCANYEKAYPGHKFAARRVGRGKFNIVWIGDEA